VEPSGFFSGREIRHIRCVLCGLQSRLSEPPEPKGDKEPIPRIEDGPYDPLIRLQRIGGSRPKWADPEGKHRGEAGWTPQEEAMMPEPEEIAMLKRQLLAALALVEQLQ
jgi:hypothetical protein